MLKGKIILLNGVSSSGKSTLSKELVKELSNFFHFSIDDYDIMIERIEDRENERLIPVPTEDFFHDTIRMFSDKGINLIIDQILHNDFTMEDCLFKLKDYPVLFVGVHCPIEELERREVNRGDRAIGQAKFQLQYVHQQNELYDIEVDTYLDSIECCVSRITEKINGDFLPLGFEKTYEMFKNKLKRMES